jgi:hypothetical protein
MSTHWLTKEQVMEKLAPRKIRVKGDVYELVREVAQPSKDMQVALGLLQDLPAIQDDFKIKVQNTIGLLNQATSDAFVTLSQKPDAVTPPEAKPIHQALLPLQAAPLQIVTKLHGLLKQYQHDETSQQLYQLELARWGLVSRLTNAAWQYVQRHLPRGQALEWLDVGKTITNLKFDHGEAYRMMLDPHRERFIKADDEGATVNLSVPTKKKPVRVTPTDLLKQAVTAVLLAAGLIATATVKTLNQYDQADDKINEAKQLIEKLGGAAAPPPENPTTQQVNSQVVWFSGACYRRVD